MVREAWKKKRERGDQREWQKNNKDKIKGYNEKRKSKKHEFTNSEWLRCKSYFDNSCAYCGISLEEHKNIYSQDLHRDHVDPNGSNKIDNCVPACKKCNGAKHDFKFEEWYRPNNEYCFNYSEERFSKIIKWLEYDHKLI